MPPETARLGPQLLKVIGAFAQRGGGRAEGVERNQEESRRTDQSKYTARVGRRGSQEETEATLKKPGRGVGGARAASAEGHGGGRGKMSGTTGTQSRKGATAAST